MVSEFGGYGWARIFPNEYLTSLYDSVNDRRWNEWWQHYYTYNDDTYNFSSFPYKLGDTLKNNQNSTLTGTNYFKAASISCKKYWDWVKVPKALVSYNNIYMFRFSEVYLMAAEAEWRLENSAQALTYLNTLRQNRILPGAGQLLTMVDEQTIIEEHARELGLEGKRWFFLKRLGLLVDRVREFGGTTMFRHILATDPIWYSQRTNIQDYHVRWPIPQGEIDAMGGFPQNQGY
jgi:hypothetical protein